MFVRAPLLVLLLAATCRSSEDVVETATDAAEPTTTLPTVKRVVVTVYYETLCSDSMRFFQKLLPIYLAHEDRIDLQLVPYGKAIHNRNATTGQWDIECQHGARECYLNMVHACLLEQLPADQAIRLLVCSMQRFSSTVELCATAEQTATVAAALACAETPHGRDLFAQHGDRTRTIQLSFVPSVAADGVFYWEEQPRWLHRFEPMFCLAYELKFGVRPASCGE